MDGIELTEEQAAIVAHDHGPAVVFAVAGSGKTTAMVHRIERLVREEVFAPDEILATSFSKACVDDLEAALSAWEHCARVDTRTLHSLGRRLLVAAPPGPVPVRPGDSRTGPAGAGYEVLSAALGVARRRGDVDRDKLDDLDHEDFLHYVGDCKGNLRYADLDAADLPASALEQATQATAPEGLEHYLDLYEVYEEVRTRRGIVTFDDMLLGGFEVLHRYPELREAAQGWYRCVIVDEFQDVNLAQFEILRLLAEPEMDYMVVGDDDQTIYEWRGARPEFILDFEERFEATPYRIQDNFRCPGPQVALANRVIEENERRVDKRINLTRGFDGRVTIDGHASEAKMGRAIVDEVLEHRRQGRRLDEIGVLLRVYAQSAYIEHHLIDEGIPYRVEGSVPFYERREVQTVLAYLRLALYDARFIRDGRAPALEGEADLGEMLCRVANAAEDPRYISHKRARQAAKAVLRENLTIQAALRAAAGDAPGYMARGMRRLAADLDWLRKGVFRRDVPALLRGLDDRVGYRAYLTENSGFDETGEGRARNVTAFIDYADAADNVPGLLAKIQALGEAHDDATGARDVLDIRTIHRAKGLEWPVVILPHVNEGTIPFSRAFSDATRLEEERRLLYVALTRAKETTHVHHLTETRLSRFLREANAEDTLASVDRVQDLLSRTPRSWDPAGIRDACMLVPELDLGRYLQRWWPARETRRRTLARSIHTFLGAVREAEALDRLPVDEEALAYWTHAFPPPEQLPPGGLGVAVDELLPEPVPADPDPEPTERAPGIPEKQRIHRLHYGVPVEHPEHGEGEVLEKKHYRGKKDILVELADGERVWVDLNEEALSIRADEPEADPDAVLADAGRGTELADDALLETLKALRLARANEDDVPAYVVAHDATLERIVEARPTTRDALGEIKGIGPHFLERYAEAFLAVLTDEEPAPTPALEARP